jgi:hypothetical protein
MLKERGHNAVDTWRGGVERRPMTSIAIAFAVGMVFASLTRWKWH